MPLPNPNANNPSAAGGMMNASQMEQYQKWTAKEAISTAFSASVLSMQANLMSKPLIRLIPGSGILKDRAEVKKRELYEAQGRDESGRKLTKQEIEERNKRRKDLGGIASLKDTIVDGWGHDGVPLGDILNIDTKFLFERMDANLELSKKYFEDIHKDVRALKEKLVDDANRLKSFKDSINDVLSGLGGETSETTDAEENSITAEEMKEQQLENQDHEEDIRKDEHKHEADVQRDEHDWWLKTFIPELKKDFGGGGGGGGGGEEETSWWKKIFGGGKNGGGGGSAAEGAAAEGGTALETAAVGAGGGAVGAAEAAAAQPGLFGKAMNFAGTALGRVARGAKSLGKGALELGGKAVAYGTEKLGVSGALEAIRGAAPKVLGWISKGAGAAIGPIIETALGSMNIASVKSDPSISKEEKKKRIGTSIGSMLGGALGSVSGSVIGAIATGAAAAGTGGAGAAIGPWTIAALNALGGVAGEYIGRALADGVGPEKIYDFANSIPGISSLISVDDQPDTPQPPPLEGGAAAGAAGGGSPPPPPDVGEAGASVSPGSAGTAEGAFAKIQSGIPPTPTDLGVLEGVTKTPVGADIADMSAQNSIMKVAPVSNSQINAPSVSSQQTNNTMIASATSAVRTGADMSPIFSGRLAFG